ncbi:MAG: hypothetical protein ABW067_10175, partial [Rhizobacter sp.]
MLVTASKKGRLVPAYPAMHVGPSPYPPPVPTSRAPARTPADVGLPFQLDGRTAAMRFQRIWGTTLGVLALATLAACGDDDGLDGANGVSALMNITAEAAGATCANGGSRIESGPDANGNGTLEAGEVTGTQYVCNGNTPVRALTATAVEASGANCATGGTRITAGADANGNGTLDAAEISSTAYVCHGATGATGASGFTQLMAMAVEPVG